MILKTTLGQETPTEGAAFSCKASRLESQVVRELASAIGVDVADHRHEGSEMRDYVSAVTLHDLSHEESFHLRRIASCLALDIAVQLLPRP